MENEEYDYVLKVILQGIYGVGKTSLFVRYFENTFTNNYIPYIGLDFKTKIFSIDNKNIKTQIYDYRSGERFSPIPSAYNRGAHGIIIIYDISNRRTFETIRELIDKIELDAPDAIKILVGNKYDLNSLREVSVEEGKKFADEFNMPFFETSAKTGYNVNEIFDFLVKDIIINDKNLTNSNVLVLNNNDKTNKINKCNK